MRMWICALIMLSCVGELTSHAQSDGEKEVESKIVALERIARLQAYDTKDLKTLDEIYDDGFVEVDLNGKMFSKAEAMARSQAVHAQQFGVEGIVVKIHGDTAIATGLYRVRGVERGKPFLAQGRFVDTWLFKNGRWVAIASLATPIGN